MENNYSVEMINITKKFGNLYANKNVTLKIKKGEIHALLGENGAGKSTIMSILFGLYSPDEGIIKINGKEVKINNPNEATKYKIGMVHQHFKLVDCYTLLENIILGSEIAKNHFVEDARKRENALLTRLYILEGQIRFLKNRLEFTKILKDIKSDNDIRFVLSHKFLFTSSQTDAIMTMPISDLNDVKLKELEKEAKQLREKFIDDIKRKKSLLNKISHKANYGFAKFMDWVNKKTYVIDQKKAAFDITVISQKYGLNVDLNCLSENASVGMQQRTEILKMLYRNADILIFDEPTAVLTPQEIESLINIMCYLKREGKTIIFITHKLNEIKAVCDRVSILRRGELIQTLDVNKTTSDELADLMVGRHVTLSKNNMSNKIGKPILKVRNLSYFDKIKKKYILNNINFNVNKGEIVSIAGIDGNGQRELVRGITGLSKSANGDIYFRNKRLKKNDVATRNNLGMSHIPEDRQKYGLVLDYDIKENLILRDFKNKRFSSFGVLKNKNIIKNANKLVAEHDIRSSNGIISSSRSMSGGNQQKIIIARELSRNPKLLVAFQPTRGVDVGAIENIHNKILKAKKEGIGVLLISYELDEIYALSDRILVIYEGEIVGEFKPNKISRQELGLYMSGAKRNYNFKENN